VRQDGSCLSQQLVAASARWCLARGVGVACVVLPDSRDVVVMTPDGETRRGRGERLPADPALPGLAPPVDDFFVPLD